MRDGHRYFSLTVVLLLIISGMTFLISVPDDIVPYDLSMNVNASYAGGNGTEANPYQISNVTQLQDMENDLNAHYSVVNNIDASITKTWNSGSGFNPVGHFPSFFNGSLNGNGYVISNLTINRSTEDHVGLFSYLNNSAVIENLGLENVNITGGFGVGALASQHYGITMNCYSTGKVQGGRFVGGLIGLAHGPITNCFTKGNVGGSDNVGGLTGDISASGPTSSCYSECVVSGDYSIGGFAGTINAGLITDCYSKGNVSGTNYIGGFVGMTFSGSVTNCHSIGNAVGTNYVGGFVGINLYEISNCYSTGNASGIDNVGGFAGRNSNDIYDCYWDVNTSGNPISDGGIGKTTTELKNRSTFSSNWDFTTVWGVIEGVSTPFLWKLYSTPSIETDNNPVAAEDSTYSVNYDGIISDYIPELSQYWTIHTNAKWLDINRTTGMVFGTPDNSEVGVFWVNVTQGDLVSETHTNFTIIVENINPEIFDKRDMVTYTNQLFLHDFNSDDDGQGTILWDMMTNADWLSPIYSENGVILGIPEESDVGVFWVNVTVNDGNSGIDWTNFSLEIQLDTDNDGIPDETDPDDDNDGVPDISDAFPSDPEESVDTDNDGTGDNQDTDDDGDGWEDDIEALVGTKSKDKMSTPSDIDGDKIPDILDKDMDQDGYNNTDDHFPADPLEWHDSDNDGIGDNSDAYPFDLDNDGVNDTLDFFPFDPSRWEQEFINNTQYHNQTMIEYHNLTVIEYNNNTIDNTKDIPEIYLNDTDNDGMPDTWELLYGLDPEDASDALEDLDNDGVSNIDEYGQRSSPIVDDSKDEKNKWSFNNLSFVLLALMILLLLVMILYFVMNRKVDQSNNLSKGSLRELNEEVEE